MINYFWPPLRIATLIMSMKLKLMNVLIVATMTYKLLTLIVNFTS
jgi:hypothetical protein